MSVQKFAEFNSRETLTADHLYIPKSIYFLQESKDESNLFQESGFARIPVKAVIPSHETRRNVFHRIRGDGGRGTLLQKVVAISSRLKLE